MSHGENDDPSSIEFCVDTHIEEKSSRRSRFGGRLCRRAPRQSTKTLWRWSVFVDMNLVLLPRRVVGVCVDALWREGLLSVVR